MDESFRIEVETLAGALDHLDYFAILKLQQGASPAEIKAAYHRESRTYHPDRFAALGDEHLRALVGRVYRRINEAYTVLRDDARRAKYLSDLSGPERESKLRFTDADEAEVREAQKRRVEEQIGQTPNGRKFYATAVKDIEAGRWEAAERSLKMALMYEPQNARFREQMDLIEKNRPKVDFRIK
ncbi:MAG TPA: DnaJ domain-containing protein [Anaeromyxobacteraceae bacterium]|nr:DnaJ domain-containing protein [Anaeromyxobacteraceae bacterium]